jgi:hypothetical protein
VIGTLPIAAQTKLLMAKTRIPVRVVGDYPSGIAFPTACDVQGRLYVKLIKAGPGMAGPLFRLSSKGTAEAEFDTSGELVNRYAVRPDGGGVMMRVNSGEFVDNFAPDGTLEPSIQLESPPTPFFPSQLAVFPSGEILISGLQYHPGYKASTAIFDSTGRLIKQLVLNRDAETERAIAKDTSAQKQNTAAIERSVAITGDDGLVYLMRATLPTVVYAISATGEVMRKITVAAPGGKGWSPDFAIGIAKNRLAVQFRRTCDGTVDSDSCRKHGFVVVDAASGKRLNEYEADRSIEGTMACFASEPDRFSIISQNDHGFEIVETEPK